MIFAAYCLLEDPRMNHRQTSADWRASRAATLGMMAVACVWATAAAARAAIRVSPAAVELHGPDALEQIIVWDRGPDGRSVDVTREVQLEVVEADAATIDERGLITPNREGNTKIVVRRGAEEARVPVVIDGLAYAKAISFERQISPLLTKAGCNPGACHGKAEGQNGFKLSVFGFDPRADVDALVKEGRGRRVFLAGAGTFGPRLVARAIPPHVVKVLKSAGSRHKRRRRKASASASRRPQRAIMP